MKYRAGALFVITTVAVLGAALAAQPRAEAEAIQCRQETLAVTLSELDPAEYHVAGKLCWKGNLADKTIQVLVHGYTYDQQYWDFPYQQPAYSYTASAVQAGYATLAIDRIGVGESDHPLPELINLITESHTIHNIVQALRSGGIEHTAFQKIVLVGHSLGTLIVWTEAGTYHDVDGVIASGWLHALNPIPASQVVLDTYPAFLDPKFANDNLAPGYVTTVPGTRGTLFYNAADADPAVIALDEQLKQTGTDGEEATFGTGDLPISTLNIHVPVLAAVGQNDSLFCSPLLLPCTNSTTIRNREQPFYSPAACLEGYALPDSGHDMNLHLNAAVWFNAANDWVARRVGSTASAPPTQPC